MITLVERCSSFAVLCPVKDRSPAALNAPVKEKFAYRRGLARETLTVDQGREFADDSGLPEAFKAVVSFAEAHGPWQKGAVEQVKGLLRLPEQRVWQGRSKDVRICRAAIESLPEKVFGFNIWSKNFRPKIIGIFL